MDFEARDRAQVAQLARWFVFLGLLAVLPAALLVGGSVGEVLRHPSLGAAEIVRHEAPVVLLSVIATFLFSTAAGLHESRTWALVMGMAEAALIVAGGLVLLVGNSNLLAAVGAPEVLALGAIPAGLAAVLLGARLFRALWRAADFALPFGAADLRALGALGAVALAGTIGHLLVSGVAS